MSLFMLWMNTEWKEVELHPFLTSALDGGKPSASPQMFTPGKGTPITRWTGSWVHPRASQERFWRMDISCPPPTIKPLITLPIAWSPYTLLLYCTSPPPHVFNHTNIFLFIIFKKPYKSEYFLICKSKYLIYILLYFIKVWYLIVGRVAQSV